MWVWALICFSGFVIAVCLLRNIYLRKRAKEEGRVLPLDDFSEDTEQHLDRLEPQIRKVTRQTVEERNALVFDLFGDADPVAYTEPKAILNKASRGQVDKERKGQGPVGLFL